MITMIMITMIIKKIAQSLVVSVNHKKTDPRNDPKYDSIDWQDDDPSKNLSIVEKDEILELEEENNSGGDNFNFE